jgi:hypothetical protein
MADDEGITPDDDVTRIRKAVDLLMEHFEAVQVFASKVKDDGDTVSLQVGRGNMFAREGHVRDWLEEQREFTRMKARRDEDED